MADIRTALKDRARHLLRAWQAIFIGLWVGLVAVTLGVIVVALLPPWVIDPTHALLQAPLALTLLVLFAGSIAFASAILATPLLMLHRFIVGPRAPYLRPGYVVVILYGPTLVMLTDRTRGPGPWQTLALYEAVVLIATTIYVGLGKRFELFPPAPKPRAPRANVASA